MAVARPMPESPPVMMAFFPFSLSAALYFWLLPSLVGISSKRGGMRHLALFAGELLVSDWDLVAALELSFVRHDECVRCWNMSSFLRALK